MSGGGGGDTKTTTTPWGPQQQYLLDLFSRAQANSQNVQKAYPDSGVAPQSPYTTQGIADLGAFGNSAYNQGVVGSSANALGTLGQAQNPGANPVSQVGYALAPGSVDFLKQTQQRAGGDFSLFPNIDTINQYVQTPQQAQVGPLASEGWASVLNPTSTLNRLQNQYNPLNIQTPQTTPTGAELLGAATAPGTAQALNAQLSSTPGSNPYVDELVRRALQANTTNFNQQVLPQISNNYEAGGGYGGSRQGIAQGLAIKSLNDTNANTAAQLYSQQYNNDLARQLQAASLGTGATATGSQAELARTAADRGYGLSVAGLESGTTSADLARQLAAAQSAGSTGLSADQQTLARIAANNAAAMNTGQFDLSKAGLGINAGSAEQQYLQGAVGQGLTAAQTGLNTLQSGYGSQLDAARAALGLAPTAQQVGTYGSTTTLGAGDIQNAYQQSIINDLMQKYYFNQQAPTEALKNYANLIGGGYGGITSASGGGTGGVAGAVGGAATGISALSLLGNSTGTTYAPSLYALTAILGGLGGYF